MVMEDLTAEERKERFKIAVDGLRKLAAKVIREETLTPEEERLANKLRWIAFADCEGFGLSKREMIAVLILGKGKKSIFE